MGSFQRDLGVGIGATAATLSPRARRAARQGAVYGLAGVLKLGDVVAATARGVAQGAKAVQAADEEAGATPERQPAARKNRVTASDA
jgi:hypothetical protein